MAKRNKQRRGKWVRRSLLIGGGAAALAVLVWALLPKPVPVELGEVTRGPMAVMVDEEGRTRVPHRYAVSAPVGGTLASIVEEPGIQVSKGDAVARIAPGAAPLLDPRAKAAAQARVEAAQADVRRAQAQVTAAESAAQVARRKWERVEKLHAMGGVSTQDYEALASEYRVSQMELESARQAVQVAQSEEAAARAALGEEAPQGAPEAVLVPAPAAGEILKVLQEDGAVVQLGTPLVEVGSLEKLEVVADVLTEDAAMIRRGNPVRIEVAAGEKPLRGEVRLVEPSAFEEVSALGIEEQRVNVIIDLAPRDLAQSNLGDGYRVQVYIQVWQEEDVLRVPTGALFRHQDGWAVFTVSDGRAAIRPVEIGRRDAGVAQVLRGLAPGDPVILYPSDKVAPGVRVEPAP